MNITSFVAEPKIKSSLAAEIDAKIDRKSVQMKAKVWAIVFSNLSIFD